MTSIEFDELSDDHVDEVIAVINAAFGFERTASWFEWKHREGPWGASRGLVAKDRRGIVGVRLLLPWRFTGPGGALLAYRAVEAATAPRAMGKGIFSRLNRHLMDLINAQEEPTFIYSTPNEQSRSGYRKLGWDWLEPVPHVWRPILPTAGAVTRPETPEPPGLDGAADTHQPRIATDWSPDAVSWRLDARSGHTYEIGTTGGDNRAGLAYRRTTIRRARALLPILWWGEWRDRTRLLRAIARSERTLLVLDTAQPGGDRVSGALGRRRGGSLLAVWATPRLSSATWPVGDIANWKLRFADLEGVL